MDPQAMKTCLRAIAYLAEHGGTCVFMPSSGDSEADKLIHVIMKSMKRKKRLHEAEMEETTKNALRESKRQWNDMLDTQYELRRQCQEACDELEKYSSTDACDIMDSLKSARQKVKERVRDIKQELVSLSK